MLDAVAYIPQLIESARFFSKNIPDTVRFKNYIFEEDRRRADFLSLHIPL